jgi:hypothetical protein
LIEAGNEHQIPINATPEPVYAALAIWPGWAANGPSTPAPMMQDPFKTLARLRSA